MSLKETFFLFVIFIITPFKFSVIIALAYLWYRLSFTGQAKGLNPFEKDDRQTRRPYVIDQKLRDTILKQGFSSAKVPDNLDAIVIGSGIGGLSTAAILSKAGKKVLVLEQHDQAGGCCHTFVDKGYEFDVGIHYVGKMHEGSIDRILCDQISDGQLEWAGLCDEYDVVSIGDGQDRRQYSLLKGRKECKALMEKQFPEETSAIDEYFQLLDGYGNFGFASGMLKLLPRWLAWILVKTSLIHRFTNLWRKRYGATTLQVVRSLTTNKDLQTVFCYCWGDYGTAPRSSQFVTQVSLANYFMKSGGYYPVGGASEIAFNIIPVIERSGGKCLVRAEVSKIVVENGRAVGVQVAKGGEMHEIRAPIVISNAGVYNTFQRLLPAAVAQKSYFHGIAKELKPGMAGINIFLGLNASKEELNLSKSNTWAFTSNDAALTPEDYFNLSKDEAMVSDSPLAFVAFPSAKDPNWEDVPGRENKSTCTIVSLANWRWFSKFENTQLKKRGDEYDELKEAIGHRLIEQVCRLHPQIRSHIDYVEIGSPVTTKHYLAQPHGEIYGLDHSLERFSPWRTAQLRPETDIGGLYLTGQDVLLCGFAGALFGGLICSGAVLGRNVMGDLQALGECLKKGRKQGFADKK